MTIDTELRDGHLIVRLAGEFDLRAADDFRRIAESALERHGCARMVLNLRKVSFIDSSGLGAILGRYRYIHQRRGVMFLVAPPPHVRAVLDLAGVAKLMPVYATEEKALAAGA